MRNVSYDSDATQSIKYCLIFADFSIHKNFRSRLRRSRLKGYRFKNGAHIISCVSLLIWILPFVFWNSVREFDQIWSGKSVKVGIWKLKISRIAAVKIPKSIFVKREILFYFPVISWFTIVLRDRENRIIFAWFRDFRYFEGVIRYFDTPEPPSLNCENACNCSQ